MAEERSGERLKHYWLAGPGALKIRWGTPGDFKRCVRQTGKYLRDPEGYCAELHHDATGMWPGDRRNSHDGKVKALGERYNPDQLRDPGGEDGGRWVATPGMSWSDLLDLYGPQHDEADAGDFKVVVFERGDFTLFHKQGNDRYEAVRELDSDYAGELANRLDEFADDAEHADPDEHFADNELVDYVHIGDSDALVGRTGDGGVVFSASKSGDREPDLDVLGNPAADQFHLDPGEARDLAGALRDMTGRYAEVGATDQDGKALTEGRPPVRRSRNRRQRPGQPARPAGLVEVAIVETGTFTDLHPDDITDREPLGDEEHALLAALAELDALTEAFDAGQARYPKGHPMGGRWRPMIDRIKDSIAAHRRGDPGHGDKHPLDGFSREQLRRVAKARGIELKRGEDRDSVAAKVLDHLGAKDGKSGPAKAKTQRNATPPKAKMPAADRTTHEPPYADRVKAAAKGRKALDAAPLSLLPRSRGDANLTPERRTLLDGFKTGDAGDIEHALLHGGEVPDGTAARIAEVDAIMADSPLTSDAQLYRVFPTARDLFGDAAAGDLTGHEWVENEFFTATASRPEQLTTPGSRGMVMQILAPKGTGAVALSAGATQEMLLDRKHTWRVANDHGRNADGLRVVDVEILPKAGGEPDNFTVVTTNVTSKDNPLSGEARANLPGTPLGRGLASGIATSEPLSGGNVGDVRLVTFNDGSRAVQKVARTTFAGRTTTDLTDSEELGGLLGRTIGAPVPDVVRTGDSEVFMDFVPDAKSGAAALSRYGVVERDGRFADLVDSRDGRLLGVLDLITGNMDRHDGNWLVGGNRKITGIDHGLLWAQWQLRTASNPQEAPTFTSKFADRLYGDGSWQPNDLSLADIGWLRSQLTGLRPQFEARGRGDWLDYSLTRLDQLAKQAQGSENRVRP